MHDLGKIVCQDNKIGRENPSMEENSQPRDWNTVKEGNKGKRVNSMWLFLGPGKCLS